MEKMIEKMIEEVENCKKNKKKQTRSISKEECHICGRSYTEKDTRVRDHCHITGKYRGFVHQDCNVDYFGLKLEDMKMIKVIFFIICRL